MVAGGPALLSAHRSAFLSFGLALLASVLLAVVPTYSGVEAVKATDAPATGRSFRATLIEVNGPRVLTLLAFPVMVSAATLLPWRRRVLFRVTVVAAGLLFAFAIFGAFSIGLFYVPSAGVMFLAAGQAADARVRRG